LFADAFFPSPLKARAQTPKTFQPANDFQGCRRSCLAATSGENKRPQQRKLVRQFQLLTNACRLRESSVNSLAIEEAQAQTMKESEPESTQETPNKIFSITERDKNASQHWPLNENK